MTITVRKADAPRPTTPNAQGTGIQEWDPMRTMRSMLQSWDPFREMVPFFTDDRFAFAPAFEVKENKDAYVFKADLPGVKENDLDVTLTGNRLTVAGKRESEKEDKGDRYYTVERTYGSFSRSFTLPDGIEGDKVHAALEHGVLTLTVPKKPEAVGKRIDVKAGGPPPAAKA